MEDFDVVYRDKVKTSELQMIIITTKQWYFNFDKRHQFPYKALIKKYDRDDYSTTCFLSNWSWFMVKFNKIKPHASH